MKMMTSAAAWKLMVYVLKMGFYSTASFMVLLGVILFLVSVGARLGRCLISLGN
jgi:hypothetical protein